ncbi:hypothetical protein Tco_0647092 [Tanacetum coccineum]
MGDSTGVSLSLGGEISPRGNKSRESNIGDSDNTGDGDTTVDSKVEECWMVLRPWLRMKQQGDDVASWWPRNGLEMLVSCLGAEVDLGVDKASSVRVPVANVTLSSSAHLLRENTDSVHSNQRMRPTAPYVPLK